MKSFDNKIKYYDLIMEYNNTLEYPKYDLKEGFHFEYYQNGDEIDWINIHIESGEFTSIDEGIKIFHDYFDNFKDELNKRCIFIINNETGEKVGTATISVMNKDIGKVDWVAIKKSYQGLHLAKPLISKLISIARVLNYNKLYLHTQTTSYLAAKLYLDLGFEPVNLDETLGWRILKTLTNHPKLKSLEPLPFKDIYNKRNVQIENILINIFKTDDFNYSVWDTLGLHNVYVYYNGISYNYEFYEKDNEVILKLINKKDNKTNKYYRQL